MTGSRDVHELTPGRVGMYFNDPYVYTWYPDQGYCRRENTTKARPRVRASGRARARESMVKVNFTRTRLSSKSFHSLHSDPNIVLTCDLHT